MRKPMSEEERKKASERMKARWAAKKGEVVETGLQTYVIMPHYIIAPELKYLAEESIKSLRKHTTAKIISVDDGSTLDASFLKDISDIYIKNPENQGFARTCNTGFKRAFQELGGKDGYIWCLNNDVEVFSRVQKELQRPFEMFDNVAITGLISSKERAIDKVPLEDFSKPRLTEGGLLNDWMQDGGSWMSKKSILEKIGLFDERFLHGGYEDIDIFLRARDTFGMKIVMSSFAAYWHKQGATRWNEVAGNLYRNIEPENCRRFIEKWGFNPHERQMFFSKDLYNP